MVQVVDLNCDCGEGFGAWRMGDDGAMLAFVTSANVACGFHAGDPDIMATTFALARENGVTIGAHPGFDDRAGFGRRPIAMSAASIERLVAYQVGAAKSLAAQAGHKLTHVKPHGALSNIAMSDIAVARAIARGAKAADRDLIFLAVTGTELARAGESEGLETVHEVYADRAYTDDGHLAPRGIEGAVLHDVDEVAARVAAMVLDGAVTALSGKRVPVKIDSICVHGDTPGAVDMARAVRALLEANGVVLRAFAAS